MPGVLRPCGALFADPTKMLRAATPERRAGVPLGPSKARGPSMKERRKKEKSERGRVRRPESRSIAGAYAGGRKWTSRRETLMQELNDCMATAWYWR